jgi:PAS domain S-box-containing protein
LELGIDITERKQMEEQVVKSEELFSKVFYANPIPATITTVSNDKLLMVNDAWLKLIGFGSQEEAIGKSAVELGLWADIVDREERNTNLQQSGSSDIQEMQVKTPSGRIRDCLYTAEMIDYEGQPHILSMAIDITQRKEAQDALKKSREEIQKQNEFLNKVLESLTYPFLVIDASNYKVKIANAAARISLLSEESTCYMLSHKLNKPCDESGCSCPLKDIKDFGHAMTMEHIHKDRNGNPQYVEVHSCPILDDKGNVTDIIEYCLDITKRKRIEEKLVAYQAQLRSLASELSLAEERQRHQIATELHDNTSQELAFALTKLQNIRETASGDSLESLNDVCEMMNNVVGNVRNMTFDICSPTLYKFGLETAVSELLEDKLGAQDEVSYSFYDDKKTKPLLEDIKIAMFQSVRELINNIIKHARANNVTVDIRRCKDTIRITVSDDGVGFKVEELESPERSRSGFGLFSIAERLKYIGGSFEFQSQPGFGSSFTLEAPLEANST